MPIELKENLPKLLNESCRSALDGALDYCNRRHFPVLELHLLIDQLVRAHQTDLSLIMDKFDVNREKLARDLQGYQISPVNRSSKTRISGDVLTLITEAWGYTTIEFGETSIRTGHLLVAILENESLSRNLYDLSTVFDDIDERELKFNYAEITRGSIEDNFSQRSNSIVPSTENSGGNILTEALTRYTVDVTSDAESGAMDPIVGRDAEIREMVNSLMRRRQNNPILVGEAGVGKTAIVEGFAQEIVKGNVPPFLQNARVLSLDIGLLQAGASMKGEFEQRLKQVVEDIQASERLIILFIDEAHTLIGAGGQKGTGDAANLLKPALARGTLRTIAATTVAEYKAHIEPDPALVRRFQTVKIDEPSETMAKRMMRAIAPAMEKYHGIYVQQDAIEASVELSHRYIPSRQLPDKSVSLLDSAAARVAVSQHTVPDTIEADRSTVVALEAELAALERHRELTGQSSERSAEIDTELASTKHRLVANEARWAKEKDLVKQVSARFSAAEPDSERSGSDAETAALSEQRAELETVQQGAPMVFASVDRQAVAAVVEDWTGIPVGRVMSSEVQTLLDLADLMEQRIIGQRHALDAVAQSLQTSRAGLDKPGKPTGVFLFAGTSGVGKTETAKALAEMMFGGEQKLITINMSEFKTPETVTALKGPPPGYVGNEKGGILTEAVKRNPYSVVLLDEIEKAHPDVNELFFRVFDEGVLDDSNGVQVDFRNTVMILTTNAGTDAVMQMCEEGNVRPAIEDMVETLQAPLEEKFSPAFLGRTQIVPFYPLGEDVLRQIIALQLNRIVSRLAENRKIDLSYDDDVIELVASRCVNAEAGGRAIDNILNKTVLPKISRELLQRTAAEQSVSSIAISVNGGAFDYSFA
jgi:type VI secretion system protein VasG